MSYKHILVPYDGSAQAQKAFDKALDIAAVDKAKITVLTVISYMTIGIPQLGASKMQKIVSHHSENVLRSMSKLEKKAKDRKVEMIPKALSSPSVVEAIVSYAKNHKVDLIVMGSRGRTGFKKLLLGSVSSGVVHHAHCTVIISR